MAATATAAAAGPDWRPLPREFFAPSAALVAPALLGHGLWRRTGAGWCGGWIVETEAYLANDPAAHSFRGPTERNRAMFGPPGRAYVYFIYGNHHCVNAVCGPAGVGEAVLIRAVEPVAGLDFLHARRPVRRPLDVTNGPGKLCAAMAIDRSLDGGDLLAPDAALQLVENPDLKAWLAAHGPVITTPRIGLRAAADWPLRFVAAGSAFVSRRATTAAK